MALCESRVLSVACRNGFAVTRAVSFFPYLFVCNLYEENTYTGSYRFIAAVVRICEMPCRDGIGGSVFEAQLVFVPSARLV